MLRSRITGAAARRAKAVLPDLPYEYHALEPYISADIMELHHSKHHATYVNNLNIANENLSEAANAGDVSKCIQLANVIKFNGGGHINHSIFWQVRRKIVTHNLSDFPQIGFHELMPSIMTEVV